MSTTRHIWSEPSGWTVPGLGPAGTTTLAVTLILAVLQILSTGNELRNMATVAAVGGLITAGFVRPPGSGRSLYNRAISNIKWFIHRSTGANLYDGSWLSTRPVTKSTFPGLISDTSVGEQRYGNDRYAIIHHPAANCTAVVFEAIPDPKPSDTADHYVALWDKWLAATLTNPQVVAVTVHTSTTPHPRAAVASAADAYVNTGSEFTRAVFRESVDQVAGWPSTRLFVTVAMKPPRRRFRRTDRWHTAERTGPIVHAFQTSLTEAVGGQAVPVEMDALARLWAVHFDPDRARPLAEHPDTIISIGAARPSSTLERRWGWTHSGHTTVGVTNTTIPTGGLTGELFARAARGIDGAVRVDTATIFTPVSTLEAAANRSGFHYVAGFRGAGKGALTAETEDLHDTDASVSRGATLTKVGVVATATIVGDDETQARTTAAKLVTMCGPLGTIMTPVDNRHQTAVVATLPGGVPLPATLTPIEDLQ